MTVALGTVFALVKELSRTDDKPLLVSGRLKDELARELRAGGDASAVRTGGAPEDVEALVHTIGDDVTEDDERVLKLAHRTRIPTLVVAAGRNVPERIPFVLATDVIRVPPGHGFERDAIAQALAVKLGENATSLARHLPWLRDAVSSHLIETFARKNGVLGAAVFLPGVDLPILTRNQLRLVLRILAAHGIEVSQERVPEIAATIGAGIGLRALARELLDWFPLRRRQSRHLRSWVGSVEPTPTVPVAGWALKGAVAYTGTKAIGEAALQYARARATRQPAAASASSS